MLPRSGCGFGTGSPFPSEATYATSASICRTVNGERRRVGWSLGL
jgi:hypothetical protein